MYKQSKNNKRNARKSRVCLFFSVISCKTCTRKTHSNIGNRKALIYLAFCRHFPSNRGESSKRQTIDSSLYSSTGGLSIRHANRPIGAWTNQLFWGQCVRSQFFLLRSNYLCLLNTYQSTATITLFVSAVNSEKTRIP